MFAISSGRDLKTRLHYLNPNHNFSISRCYCSRSLHFEPIIDFHGCSTYPSKWSPPNSLSVWPPGRLSLLFVINPPSEKEWAIAQKQLDVWNWYQSQLLEGMSQQGTKTPQKTNHGASTLSSMATLHRSICGRAWEQPKQAWTNQQFPCFMFPCIVSLMDKILHQLIYVYKVHNTIILFVLVTVC